MASNSGTDAPSAATCQSNFEQGVALALHLWPDLTLAVQNNWGGPDSKDKRDWFAGAIVDLFADLGKPATADGDAETLDAAYVEEFLLQVMVDEFDVNVDDDSSLEVAEQVVRVREECAKGKFDEVEALRQRFESRKGSAGKVSFQKVEDEENDTDWDTDEDSGEGSDEGDVEMGEAPSLVQARKEKEEPEVDEDGFTKVTRKKR